MHAFMRSCIHSFVHAFMHSFIHSFMHSFVHSLIRSLPPAPLTSFREHAHCSVGLGLALTARSALELAGETEIQEVVSGAVLARAAGAGTDCESGGVAG